MKTFAQRTIQRETHSPRSGMAVLVAILVSALTVYCLLELLLAGLGEPSWLIHPLEAARWLAELPGDVAPVLLGVAGVFVALLGLILLGNAFLPGRRARHAIEHPRVAIVVDDEVIASALARRARTVAGVTREQVMVVVSAHTVQVNVRPTSGIRLSETMIHGAVEAELARMNLTPHPTVTVRIAESGVIGV